MKRILPLLVASLALPAFAEDPPPPPTPTGFPPYGSFEHLAFDTVNRQNLNFRFAIPIASSPGRGFDLSHALTYDSTVWKIHTLESGARIWTPVLNGSEIPSWGWTIDNTSGSITHKTTTAKCPAVRCDDQVPPICSDYNQLSIRYEEWVFTDPSGTQHAMDVAFHSEATDCNLNTTDRSGLAFDGSGYFLDATDPLNPVVYSPGGARFDNSDRITDPNGNFFERMMTSPNHFEWKDTRGKTALRIVLNPPGSIDYEVLDPNGTYQTTRVQYSLRSVRTKFACGGITEYSGNAWLPTRVDLPNGRAWTFDYEQTPPPANNCFGGCVNGRLSKVTLPTGGVLQYSYPGANMGLNCEDGSAIGLARVELGSSTGWTFDRQPLGGTSITTVWDPALPYGGEGRTEYTFTNGRETKQRVYAGTTLLRTVDTTWDSGSLPTPKTRTVTLDDGTKSRVETTFDAYGNLLRVKEYGFGAGTIGPLLRDTTNTYVSASEYIARNIRNRLSSQVVKDGSGQVVSRTDIVYDDYPQEPLVCVTGAPQHDDTNYGCSFETRGNPTHVKRYLDPAGATNPIVRAVQYDSLGNARTAELDCCQERQFLFSAATGWAFPHEVVSGPPGGPQLKVLSTYNPHTGQLATSTDANGQVTSFLYDLWKRPTKVTRPDGTEFTTAYDDVARTVTTTAPLTATTSRKSKTYFDTYGRPFKTELRDGADTLIAFTESQFDSMGRAWRTSNPRGSPSDPAYWTETRWDALGRPTVVIPPDGTATSNSTRYSYLGNSVTLTDPAGNQKKTVSDALGRMVELWEPNPASPSELLLTTQYAWTTLGNLSTVTQGSQTRTYTWDALGRMTSETTPEAGTVKYTVIDSYGNVRERVVGPVNPTDEIDDVTTIFSYDGLNRLTGVSWEVATGLSIPVTPSVSYVYGTDTDGSPNDTGRLKTITDGLGTETLTYDLLGRVTDRQRVIDGQSPTFAFHYTHNLADEVTSVTYPSGRVVNYGQDAAGRLTTVTTGGTNLLSNLAWSPAGLPTGWTYGNGVTASFGWTPERLLLSEIRYDRPQPGGTMLNLTYEYGTAAGNDGRITKINDLVVPDRTMEYSFDALGRLKTANNVGGHVFPRWCLAWDYDSFANRVGQRNTDGEIGPPGTLPCPGNPPEMTLLVDAATNRVTSTGWTHDATGNVTATPDGSFSIDAAGRTIGHTPASGPALVFAFDATGLRTKRTEGASTTLYLRDGGQVIGEWNGTSWTKEYVWLGSTLVATIEGSTIKYHHQDHLSIRATTFADGMVGEEQGHYPFGEPWYETSPETTRIFTTYEREAGGSLDYAMFRWMGPEAGRFLSADPLPGSMGDGQSWNRYAYAGNDPVNRWDPWGLETKNKKEAHEPNWLLSWFFRYAYDSVTSTASAPSLRGGGGGGGGGGGAAGGPGGGDRFPPGFERLRGRFLEFLGSLGTTPKSQAGRTCTGILNAAMGFPSIGSAAVGITLGLFGTPLGGQVSLQLARSASGQQGILLTGAGGVSGGTSAGLAATLSGFSTSDLRRLEGWGIQGGSSGAISGAGPTVGAELVFGLDRLPSPGNTFTADATFGGVDVNLGLGAGIEGHGMPSNSVIVPLLGPADICRLLFD